MLQTKINRTDKKKYILTNRQRQYDNAKNTNIQHISNKGYASYGLTKRHTFCLYYDNHPQRKNKIKKNPKQNHKTT